MKKAFLITAIAVMTVISANAQGFEWGVKAGINLAWQTEFQEPIGLGGGMETQGRTGLYAGVFAEKVINDFFGVQGELLYSQMGQTGKTGNTSYGDKLDYLILPVLAKLYVLENLSLDLGPQFEYMLSKKGVGNSGNNDMSYVNRFGLTFAAGLSYKIAGRFDVSARYNLGLTKVYEYSDAKNNAISLGVGYRF